MVYDVTKFLSDDPGGKDATSEFEEAGHSSSAKAMLDEFYVGDIDSTKAKHTVTTANSNRTKQYQNNKKSELLLIKFLQFLVPFLVLGLALYVLFYTRASSSP